MQGTIKVSSRQKGFYLLKVNNRLFTYVPDDKQQLKVSQIQRKYYDKYVWVPKVPSLYLLWRISWKLGIYEYSIVSKY